MEGRDRSLPFLHATEGGFNQSAPWRRAAHFGISRIRHHLLDQLQSALPVLPELPDQPVGDRKHRDGARVGIRHDCFAETRSAQYQLGDSDAYGAASDGGAAHRPQERHGFAGSVQLRRIRIVGDAQTVGRDRRHLHAGYEVLGRGKRKEIFGDRRLSNTQPDSHPRNAPSGGESDGRRGRDRDHGIVGSASGAAIRPFRHRGDPAISGGRGQPRHVRVIDESVFSCVPRNEDSPAFGTVDSQRIPPGDRFP